MNASPRHAASRTEVLILMLVIGVIVAVAAPYFTDFLSHFLADNAAKRIASDLRFAQYQARVSGAPRAVHFAVDSQTLTLRGTEDSDCPSSDYAVKLSEAPYSVALVSSDFGGDSQIVFDPDGRPDSGGSVLVKVGSRRRTITVDSETGEVSVR